MANQWLRLYSEFADDPKVQSMSEAMQRRLIMLFCIHNKNVLATLQDDEIATALRLDATELEETKQLFIKKGFLNSAWNLLNWDKRQFVSDSSTDRSRKHRDKNRLMQQQCNVAATSPDTDTDTDTDTEKERSKDIRHDPIGSCPFSAYPENQTGNSKLLNGSKKRHTPSVPYQQIVDLYHQILPMCPQTLVLTDRLKVHMATRWREYDNLALWREFFERVAKSDFLTGKTEPTKGRKPFKASLRWLVLPENFAKSLEESYG